MKRNERMRPLVRRMLPLLLLALMTVLAACGSNDGNDAAANNAPASANAVTSADENAVEAPEVPTAEDSAPAAEEEPAPAVEEAPVAHNDGHTEEQPAKPAAEEPALAAEEPAASPEPAPEPKPAPAAEPASEAPAAEEQPAAEAEGTLHVVEIVDFAFSPETLTIAKGDRISFINLDAVGHTATADDESFDTKMLGKDESAEIIFGEAGEFGYYCLPHPGMRGTIIVQ